MERCLRLFANRSTFRYQTSLACRSDSLGFYAVVLAPLSGIVAFGPHLVADRFAYLPCAGLTVLAGAGLFYCWRLRASSRIGVRTLVFTHSLAVLLVTGLGVLSWHQTQIWHDS